MIDLTPLEVRQKKGDFRRAMRGYEPALVDDFLDIVADRLEALTRESRALGEEVAHLRASVADFKERERALTEALVSAQEMREEVRKQAERSAELTRREAEAEIERMRAEAVADMEREQEAMRQLRARRAQLLRSFRTFLERELSELAVAEESLDAEAEEPRPAARRKRSRATEAAAPAAAEEPAAMDALAAEDVPTAAPAPAAEDPQLPLPESATLEWLSTILREES